jgi:exopolysaccharide biosynthesis polyprenyl glycosylphosphotransferase
MSFVLSHTPQRAIVLAVALLAALLALFHVAGWPTAQAAVTGSDGVVILSATATLALLAAILNGVRYRENGARLGTISAQALFRLVSRRLAPPAVAATLTVAHTGHAGDAVAVFAAMVLATAFFRSTHYPFHLGGVARFVFDLFMPALGISAALLAASIWGVSLDAEALTVPLLGAWFVTFAGGWFEEAFNAERPVRLAVIGGPGLARAFALEMQTAGVRDHRVVGWVSGADRAVGAGVHENGTSFESLGLEWLGCIEDVRSAVVEQEIDLLVMTQHGASPDLVQEVVERCVDLPVRMVQASYLYEELHGRVPIAAINSAWFAYIMHPNFSARATWTKRLMDMSVAALLLVLLAPLFALVAVAVKLSDRGPILFRQRRVGAHGHDFYVLKFRTMVVDAEPLGAARWASQDDDRTTRVGRLLRRRHLDEIPQLINVLVGTMSLVGPRPERPEFVTRLETKIPYYSRRLLVKPGITGWAQVRSGYAGSDMGTAFKLSHDLYYIKHRSLVFDLLTMVETARTLVADVEGGQFTMSEGFILGGADFSEPAEIADVLGDMAALARDIEHVEVGHEGSVSASPGATAAQT